MAPDASVTGPQRECIALLAEGLSLPDIAAKVGVDLAGVNGLIREACLALGAVDRVHLIAVAYQTGVLEVPGMVPAADLDAVQAKLTTAETALPIVTRHLANAVKEAETHRQAWLTSDKAVQALRAELDARPVAAPAAPPKKPGGRAVEQALDWAEAQLRAMAEEKRLGIYRTGVGPNFINAHHAEGVEQALARLQVMRGKQVKR